MVHNANAGKIYVKIARFILALCLLFVAIIYFGFFASIFGVKKGIGEWKEFSHETYNINLIYPDRLTALEYGKSGYRGLDDVKLILIESWIHSSSYYIEVRLIEQQQPSLDETLRWEEQLLNNSLNKVDSIEDSINGQPIIRSHFTGDFVNGERLHYQVIYMARANDMIIIIFRATESLFIGNQDEFNRILESFTPVKKTVSSSHQDESFCSQPQRIKSPYIIKNSSYS